MASITSVISFFVLLATFCNSLPVENQFKSTTAPTTHFEFTTGKTIVDNEDKITMHLLSDEESTGVPKILPPRVYDEHEHYEYTTPAHSELHDDFSRPPRMMNDILFTTESPLSDLTRHESYTDDFLDTTTLESGLHFERKPFEIKNTQPKEKQSKRMGRVYADTEDMETTISTEFFSSTPVVEYESFTTEPSTSGDSFGRFTGLLANDRTQETPTKMSSGIKFPQTSESEQDDHSKEESKFLEPSKITQRLTKTILVVPGKLTETQTFTDARSKSYLMEKPSQTELTQGEKQSDI
jgi:hypothetical protein